MTYFYGLFLFLFFYFLFKLENTEKQNHCSSIRWHHSFKHQPTLIYIYVRFITIHVMIYSCNKYLMDLSRQLQDYMLANAQDSLNSDLGCQEICCTCEHRSLPQMRHMAGVRASSPSLLGQVNSEAALMSSL